MKKILITLLIFLVGIYLGFVIGVMYQKDKARLEIHKLKKELDKEKSKDVFDKLIDKN